jgi:Isochorismatase family
MTEKVTLNPKTSALLVMDVQTVVVEMVATDKEALLARTAKLIDSARTAGMKVIYVVVGFRLGYPEVSARNASFGPIRASGRFDEGSPGLDVHPAVAPQPGEIVVTKPIGDCLRDETPVASRRCTRRQSSGCTNRPCRWRLWGRSGSVPTSARAWHGGAGRGRRQREGVEHGRRTGVRDPDDGNGVIVCGEQDEAGASHGGSAFRER